MENCRILERSSVIIGTHINHEIPVLGYLASRIVRLVAPGCHGHSVQSADSSHNCRDGRRIQSPPPRAGARSPPAAARLRPGGLARTGQDTSDPHGPAETPRTV